MIELNSLKEPDGTKWKPKGKKVLLYSGGMDSWLISKIWKPDVLLYIDLNSSYSKEEVRRLPDNVIVETLDLSKFERDDKIIPLRNLMLVALATNYGDEICLGATYGDRVLDKTPVFAEKTSDLLSYLYQEQHWTEQRDIKVNVDFKQYTKTELIAIYKSHGGSLEEVLHESFSCYNPDENGNECWSCKPCFRKFIALYLNDYKFSRDLQARIYEYLDKEIIPEIKSGVYDRGKENVELLNAYARLAVDLGIKHTVS